MAHIHECPTELLQLIFQDACSDDPRACCSLRLVDRRISAACVPFTHVAVSGEKRIRALLRALKTSDPSITTNIQRLSISDRIREEADDRFDYIMTFGSCIVDEEEDAHDEAVMERHLDEAERLEKLVAGILRRVAPRVTSLCILSFNPEFTGVLGCFGDLAFPLLTDLTLRFTPRTRMDGAWRAAMPDLRAFTCRFSSRSRDNASTGPRLLNSLAEGGKLTKVILPDYEPKPQSNSVVRDLCAKNGPCQLKYLEVHPVGTINVDEIFYFGHWLDKRALIDLQSMSADGSMTLVVERHIEDMASYDTWKKRWRSQR
ncbi:unnamed protein product [Peniophora sp. CBMAI 1063]|nr:unnamed protein product [Peniophora sp. CBMAI 1063]